MFTDKCTVKQKDSTTKLYVFLPRGSQLRYHKDYIDGYPKNRGFGVMLWAAIYGSYRSPLVFLERDFESKKMGYSSASYIKILEDNLSDIILPDTIFMQDNAPIHKSKATMDWLRRNKIELLEDWPPYSPDLNPIEHIWYLLKARAYKLFPEMAALRGGQSTVEAAMRPLLESAWRDISVDIVGKLTDSFIDRISAVIEADGWYTKY